MEVQVAECFEQTEMKKTYLEGLAKWVGHR